MKEGPDGAANEQSWVIAAVTVLVLLALCGAAVAGFVVGMKSGPDLGQARRIGAREGRRQAVGELTPRKRRAARRQGLKSGYNIAYKTALRTTRAKAAAGGPHNCGDAKTNDTPSIGKVRAEGVSCAAALDFARGALTCQSECHGYTCSNIATGYEEGETTCRRGSITIRFLSGV